MADLTPYVDLTEKVIDNPSAVQVDNSFIVGAVVVVSKTDVAGPTLVRSQKELMQHFNGGNNISESCHVTLKNAYRLVTSCALRLMPFILINESIVVGRSSAAIVTNRSGWGETDILALELTAPGQSVKVQVILGADDVCQIIVNDNAPIFYNLTAIELASTNAQLARYKLVLTPNPSGYTTHTAYSSDALTIGGGSSSTKQEAFDELYRDELLTYSMFSDLGDTDLSVYIEKHTDYYRTSDGVLLRTPVFASLSGPNGTELPTRNTKSANGDQWIYHFPWGVDSTSASFKIDVSPSVMYIESVVAARNAGHPYAGIYAHRFGVVSNAPELKINLGREDRDKLLGLGYNTIFKDERARYNHTVIVSNRTSTTLNNPMNKESHRRLANKINTDAFIIAEDFIGRVITDLLYEEVTSTFKSYIEGQILVYPETLESYNVICDRTNNDDMDRANNRINIDIQGKFSGEADYINILSTYFSVSPADEAS